MPSAYIVAWTWLRSLEWRAFPYREDLELRPEDLELFFPYREDTRVEYGLWACSANYFHIGMHEWRIRKGLWDPITQLSVSPSVCRYHHLSVGMNTEDKTWRSVRYIRNHPLDTYAKHYFAKTSRKSNEELILTSPQLAGPTRRGTNLDGWVMEYSISMG